jgi:hypothetical protein
MTAVFLVRAGDCRFTLQAVSANHLFPGPNTTVAEGPLLVSRLNDGNMFVHDGRHRVIRTLIEIGPDTMLEATSEHDDDGTAP